MEKTITFTMTETQARKFEKLLDKFNSLFSHSEMKSGIKEVIIKPDTKDLLSQAKEDLKQIKRANANRKKMIWEQ